MSPEDQVLYLGNVSNYLSDALSELEEISEEDNDQVIALHWAIADAHAEILKAIENLK